MNRSGFTGSSIFIFFWVKTKTAIYHFLLKKKEEEESKLQCKTVLDKPSMKELEQLLQSLKGQKKTNQQQPQENNGFTATLFAEFFIFL